jgi:hypothetical protein
VILSAIAYHSRGSVVMCVKQMLLEEGIQKQAQKNDRIHIFDNVALIEVLLRHISQDKVNSSTFRKSILIPNLVEG